MLLSPLTASGDRTWEERFAGNVVRRRILLSSTSTFLRGLDRRGIFAIAVHVSARKITNGTCGDTSQVKDVSPCLSLQETGRKEILRSTLLSQESIGFVIQKRSLPKTDSITQSVKAEFKGSLVRFAGASKRSTLTTFHTSQRTGTTSNGFVPSATKSNTVN